MVFCIEQFQYRCITNNGYNGFLASRQASLRTEPGVAAVLPEFKVKLRRVNTNVQVSMDSDVAYASNVSKFSSYLTTT